MEIEDSYADGTGGQQPPGLGNGVVSTQQYMMQQQQQSYVPHKARLQCYACTKMLEYDAGAQYVQCFSCSTMNGVNAGTQVGGRVLSMLCPICHTTNLAPYGVNYVRCGTCHTISQVSHAYSQQPMGQVPQQSDPRYAQEELQQQQQMASMMQQQQQGQQQMDMHLKQENLDQQELR